MKTLSLICSLFLLSSSILQAYYPSNEQNSVQACPTFGNSGFGGNPALWYNITTNSYPDVTLLSQQSNRGSSEGNIFPSPTGFTIGEEGDYWVEITVVLQNPGEEPILIPFFLVENEIFDGENPQVGGVVTLFPGVITSAHGTGFLKDVAPGTRLSIVATNGGAPLPQELTIVAWNINIFKL